MPVIPAGFGQLTFVFGGAGVPLGAVCTLGIDSGVPVDPNAAVDGIHNAAGIMHEGLSTPTVELVRTELKLGPNATGPTYTSTGNAIPGETGAHAVPPNVSILIQKRTALGGRQGRGRMYWPGMSEENVDPSGIVGSAWLAAAQPFVDDFWTYLDVNGVPPVLLHENASPAPTPILSFVIDNRVATQRDRLRR